MINEKSILEWRKFAPWIEPAYIEQDLIISRALIEIYNHPYLKNKLVFRGGTAISKIFYQNSPIRYSEDIDLVQKDDEPVGLIYDGLSEALEPWLGVPRKKSNDNKIAIVYRFTASDALQTPLRLKIEINTREQNNFLPLKKHNFVIHSSWFSGAAEIFTYDLNELLGTKLRALYQRKKGRDLFDMARAIEFLPIDINQVIECFYHYLDINDHHISRAEFEKNMILKKDMPTFREDIKPLLVQGTKIDFDRDFDLVMNRVISKLSGDPWKGEKN